MDPPSGNETNSSNSNAAETTAHHPLMQRNRLSAYYNMDNPLSPSSSFNNGNNGSSLMSSNLGTSSLSGINLSGSNLGQSTMIMGTGNNSSSGSSSNTNPYASSVSSSGTSLGSSSLSEFQSTVIPLLAIIVDSFIPRLECPSSSIHELSIIDDSIILVVVNYCYNREPNYLQMM